MIRNDGLENRLNAKKNGGDIQEFINENEKSLIEQNPIQEQDEFSWYNLILYLIEIFLFFIKSFTFGYSIKLLMNAKWDLFSFTCLGLGVTFILETLGSFFNKK
jgi:hypothetical protein